MSKEFKGTKEWQISKIDSDDLKLIYIYKESKHIVKGICYMCFENEITEEVEANAKLIKNAPEMLEVLQFFVNNNMLSIIGEEIALRIINDTIG
jgi:hypothetical protein